MVGVFHLATLVSLAFGAVASCKRYAVDVQPFPSVDCVDHNRKKAFTAKEGDCRSSHFKRFPAEGIRITSHGRNVDKETRACRLYWYETKHCTGASGHSEDFHIDTSFKCYNSTILGADSRPVGARSVRLHCNETGPMLGQLYSTVTTRCTLTHTFPTTKPDPTSSTSARVVTSTKRVEVTSTKQVELTVPVVMPIFSTQFATATRSVGPSSSSSKSATATIKSTTTIVAPPTATIEGTTTVWVASSSSKSSTTSSSKISTTSSTKSSTTSSSTKSPSVSTKTIVSSAARTVTSTVTPSSSSTHHSTRTSTWVAVITDAANMNLDRRSDGPFQSKLGPDGSIECYISIGGRWLISTCYETTKAVKTASA